MFLYPGNQALIFNYASTYVCCIAMQQLLVRDAAIASSRSNKLPGLSPRA